MTETPEQPADKNAPDPSAPYNDKDRITQSGFRRGYQDYPIELSNPAFAALGIDDPKVQEAEEKAAEDGDSEAGEDALAALKSAPRRRPKAVVEAQAQAATDEQETVKQEVTDTK